jgi:hypothetical protein
MESWGGAKVCGRAQREFRAASQGAGYRDGKSDGLPTPAASSRAVTGR